MVKRLKWGTLEYLKQLIDEYFESTKHPTIAGLCVKLNLSRSAWKYYIYEKWRTRNKSPEDLAEIEAEQDKKSESEAFEELTEISARSYITDGTNDCDDIANDQTKEAVSKILNSALQRLEEAVLEQIFTSKNPAGGIFYAKAALGYRENDSSESNNQTQPSKITINILPPPQQPQIVEVIEAKPTGVPHKLPGGSKTDKPDKVF